MLSALLLTLQTPDTFALTTLVLEGDAVPGVGAVTRIDNLNVQSQGRWFCEVDTDNADTNADSVLLLDGAVLLREGDALAQPPGATLDSFDSIELDDLSNTSFNHFLDGTSSSNDDSGIYAGSALLIQESDAAPSFFSPGSTYVGFFETKRSGGDHVLVLATIDDPLLGTGLDRGLVRLQLDAGGAVVAVENAGKTGDVLPGQSQPVDDFGTNPHALAMNKAGSVMYVADLEGDSATDGLVAVDGLTIAQEGSPASVPGRNWESLSSSKVDLNNLGEVVWTGNMDGSTSDDLVITSSAGVVAREGDVPPGGVAPGSTLTSFGSGPVKINDRGEVLWFGSWGSGTGALFLDDQPLVVQGVTQIGGQTLTTIRGVQDGYDMSAAGGHIVFEGILASGDEGLFLLTREAVVQPLPDCSGLNPATLALTAGTPTPGAPITLEAGGSSFALAQPVLALSADALVPDLLPCGLVLPGLGEVYVDPGPGLLLVNLPVYSGAPVSQVLNVPANGGLVGLSVFGQAAFVDLGSATPSLELSDGLRLQFGA